MRPTYGAQPGARSARELSSRVSDPWYAESVALLTIIDKAKTVNAKVRMPTECIECNGKRDGAFFWQALV